MPLVYIQILRFIAATAVVVYHAAGTGMLYFPTADNKAFISLLPWLEYGGHGVDLFFVISGFIIFYSTHRENLTPGKFLRRRLERIVPMYLLSTLVIFSLVLLLPDLFKQAGTLDLSRALKSIFYVSFTDGVMPVVYVGWSLEFEMYFYLMVAVLLAASTNAWRAVTVIFSAFVIAGQIAAVPAALGNYAFFVDALIFEFVLGILVASIFTGASLGALAWAAAACALAGLFVVTPGSRAVTMGLPSAALVLAAAYLSRIRLQPSMAENALGRLGDASYSIYLVQVFTISAAGKVVAKIFPALHVGMFILLATAFTVFAGWLASVLVEKPLLSLSRSYTARNSKRPVVTAVTSRSE